MNVQELVRDTLQDWSQEAVRPEPDLADLVLRARHRRRVRDLVAATVALVAVIAAAAVLPALTGRSESVRPASFAETVLAHPGQSPPRELIAAGDTAVSAFSATRWVKQANGDKVLNRDWQLHNPATGRYEKTEWAWLDVAPGMETAAVLEGELPAERIGLLDTAKGKVGRWIDVDRGVASVQWSPDGKRLLATTYSRNPDRFSHEQMRNVNGKEEPGPVPSRTGFYVIDVPSGDAKWSKLPFGQEENGFPGGNAREDIEWSHDGSLVRAPSIYAPGRVFHDLDGRKVPAPKAEKYVGYPKAGLSPDGRRVAGDFAGKDGGINSSILSAGTGEPLMVVPGQQLLAWADNSHLIAWGCDPAKCSGKGEFRNQLLVVSLKSEKVIPLSGFRKASDEYDGRWTPVFSRR